MKIAKVYFQDQYSRRNWWFLNDDYKRTFTSKFWWNLKVGYYHVADVELFPYENKDDLFYYTNSIDMYWGKHPNVTLHNGLKHRSSMVGDIFVIENIAYIVNNFGFLSFELDKM